MQQGSYSFEHLKFHDLSMTFQSFPWQLNLIIFLGNFLDFGHILTLFFTKNNLPNLFCTINSIFHDFPWPKLKIQDFPGLENEILKFHDFPGFSQPVWTLCKTHKTDHLTCDDSVPHGKKIACDCTWNASIGVLQKASTYL